MSAWGYFTRFTSTSIAEDMLDWLAKQKNVILARADKEWCLTIKGRKFRGEDLVNTLIEAESMIDDDDNDSDKPHKQKSDIRKKRQAFGAVSGDNSK